MQELRIRFVERIRRTPTVKSFRFIPEEKIEFIPGQFLQLLFDPQNSQNMDLNKYLSFSSSPTKEYIEVTKRLSESMFSQRLKGLKTGDSVLIKAPLGNCVFKPEYQKTGFLIGGIGITPVISIIEYIMNKNLSNEVLLLYSNSTQEEIAFKQELDLWKKTNKNIKIFYTLTNITEQSAEYLCGSIREEVLLDVGENWEEKTLFIFGPPGMVTCMQQLALQVGCRKENIKTESFIGY